MGIKHLFRNQKCDRNINFQNVCFKLKQIHCSSTVLYGIGNEIREPSLAYTRNVCRSITFKRPSHDQYFLRIDSIYITDIVLYYEHGKILKRSI